MKEIPPPAPLVFTPSKGLPKIQCEFEIITAKTAEEERDWETIDDCESEVLENVQVAEDDTGGEVEASDDEDSLSCLNCDAEMTPDHQCISGGHESHVENEEDLYSQEDSSELLEKRDRLRKVAKLRKELEEGKTPSCWNCEAKLTFDHHC